MVSSASAAAQASENERRRKQTMERAKAVHLSRQLQMRLQYARLKVEHGWQKQNLNEVENLYFHHSHLRGPKPFPAPSVIAIHPHATSFVGPSTGSVQSSLSFKLATPSLGRSSISVGPLQCYDQSKNDTSNEDSNTASSAQPSCPINDYTTLSNTDPSLRLTTPDFVDVDVLEDAEVTLSLPYETGKDHASSLGDQIDAISLPSPPRNSKSPVDPALSLTNSLPTVKPQRGRSQKAPTALKAPSTLSTKDMFNFSSSSNLTYDSFWSSHTGPTAPQSTRGSYTDSFADYPPTFPSSGGDYNNGISTTSQPSNNPILTSNNIVPQPNPDLQRNFGVPA
ncbi:hypothetical protein BYT27DRAFT_7134146 [Phlegmacium glaucopus]|nr:hypothetical protein BYT27DRAFT_7134146 [Phlegmacium glaucopus]